jgi:hypothetical protein
MQVIPDVGPDAPAALPRHDAGYINATRQEHSIENDVNNSLLRDYRLNITVLKYLSITSSLSNLPGAFKGSRYGL